MKVEISYMNKVLKDFVDRASEYKTHEELEEGAYRYLEYIYKTDEKAQSLIKEQYVKLCTLRWSDYDEYTKVFTKSIWPKAIERVLNNVLIEADLKYTRLMKKQNQL